jgi:hypothetical protein
LSVTTIYHQLSGWFFDKNESVESWLPISFQIVTNLLCSTGSTASTCASVTQMEALVMAITGRGNRFGSSGWLVMDKTRGLAVRSWPLAGMGYPNAELFAYSSLRAGGYEEAQANDQRQTPNDVFSTEIPTAQTPRPAQDFR